jgi:hypothetical protein
MQLGLHSSSCRGFESRRAWQQTRSSAVEHTKRASALSQHFCRLLCFFNQGITDHHYETPANAVWEYIGNQRGSNPAPHRESARTNGAENSQQSSSPAF